MAEDDLEWQFQRDLEKAMQESLSDFGRSKPIVICDSPTSGPDGPETTLRRNAGDTLPKDREPDMEN